MPKAKKKLKKWQITLLVILGVLLLLFLFLLWFYYAKLSLMQYDTSSGVSIDTEVSVDDDDLNIETSGVSNIDIPAGEIYQNDNVINILLLGTDERAASFSDNARADSMMVLSIDKKYHTVKLVSFERGLGVSIPGRSDDWLTHTFRYGGANLTMQTIRETFCVDVDRYVRVNFNTFEQIIDTIGGVDLTLSAEEANALQYSTSTSLKAGVNHLYGSDALLYCRLRAIDSDWVRVQRQRNTIQAIINQTKTLNLLELNSLLDKILPLVRTNLTKGEITGLLFEAPYLMGAQTDQMTIPKTGTYWGITGVDGRSMYACDYEENRRTLREFFYGPYLSEE